MIVDGSVWPHLRATFQIWFAGFAIASLVGILIGLLAGTFRPLQALANPWLNVMDSLPDLALIPIFILWFGIGAEFKIFLVFFSCLFFVAVNTMKGTEIIARQYDEVARSLGPSRLLHFRSILLPGSFPFIITGLRQGAARGLVGVIVAEFVSAQAGIGFMISVAGATLNTERVMFGIFILAIAGIGVGELLGRIEKRYQAWVPDG